MRGSARRPVTRSMTKAQLRDGSVHGALRCTCGGFLVGAHDQLIQCVNCNNWLHPDCAGIDAQPTLLARSRHTFVCPFCTGEYKKRMRPAESTQMVKLIEVPDCRPAGGVVDFDLLVVAIRRQLADMGYTPIEYPRTPLTDAMIEDGLDCCKTSIAALTFSESYPIYCMHEQQQNHHKYLQGAAARDHGTQKIVSMVLGNGMDPYTNLRGAITQVKALLTRRSVRPTSITHEALSISAVDDFVHFTLIVTADPFRGRGLAKRLLLLEMARWCARGRTRAFLNMALEKEVVGDKTVCRVSDGPRRLYSQCGFTELCERLDSNGREVWTKREEDMGRIMVNLDMPGTVRRFLTEWVGHDRGNGVVNRRTVVLRSPAPKQHSV